MIRILAPIILNLEELAEPLQFDSLQSTMKAFGAFWALLVFEV